MPFLRTNVRHFQPRRGIAGYVAAVRGMGQCDPSDLTCLESDGGGGAVSPGPIAITSLPDLPVQPINVGTIPTQPTLPTPAAPTTPTQPSSLAQILASLAQGSQVGAQLFKSLQTPSLIPGTGVLYNPATNSYYNPQTGQVVAPPNYTTGAVLGTASFPLLLVGGLAIGGILLISAMKH